MSQFSIGLLMRLGARMISIWKWERRNKEVRKKIGMKERGERKEEDRKEVERVGLGEWQVWVRDWSLMKCKSRGTCGVWCGVVWRDGEMKEWREEEDGEDVGDGDYEKDSEELQKK